MVVWELFLQFYVGVRIDQLGFANFLNWSWLAGLDDFLKRKQFFIVKSIQARFSSLCIYEHEHVSARESIQAFRFQWVYIWCIREEGELFERFD